MPKDQPTKEVIYAEDMTDAMMDKAVEVARTAFQAGSTANISYTSIATHIRQNFDKDYSRSWNCVVGRHFGAYVTHEIKTYIYFSVVPGVSVLLWKT